MKELLKSFLGVALVIAVSYLVGFRIGRNTARIDPESTIIRDTVSYTIHDTITRERPVFIKSYVYDTVRTYFTTIQHDTVTVDLPMERKVYQEDSLYRAVVSGPRCGNYEPSLDSLVVWPTTTTITIREKEKIPAPKIGFGLTAGPSVLVAPDKKMHGGIGVTAGIQYRF